jgi:uncharacterized surface protein with fasciclin (FAS1) repeats
MTKKMLALMAACASLAAVAVGCGGDDEQSASAGTPTEQQTETAASQRSKTIVAVAQDNRQLTTLVQAVTAGQLVETLQGKGPLTVFAPTNAAFAKLDAAQLNQLLRPENRAQLQNILTYHVVPGELRAAELKDGQKLKTVQGEQLTVRIAGGQVKVGGATVVKPDVDASNGVVHVIDTVLTPPAS